MKKRPDLTKVFFDANSLIAGSASTTGASFLLLQLCELNLLKGYTSQQVIDECTRNILKCLPQAKPYFEKIVELALEVIEDPAPIELLKYESMAHVKDLPILVAALKIKADYLITFNIPHFNPDPSHDIIVVKPGDLLQKIRMMLNQLIEDQ